MHRLDGPFDTLASIPEYDPHLLVIGDYVGDLSVVDICDALRTPRQLRPLGLMLTTSVSLPHDDISELGVDEIIQTEIPAAMYSGSLLQHFRLSKMSRTLLLREQEILDSLPNPLFVVDRDLVLWKCNRDFTTLIGLPGEAGPRRVLGRPLSAVWPVESGDGLQSLQLALRNRQIVFRFRHWQADSERTFAATITPLKHEPGRSLIDLHDVTEQEQSLLAEARRERLATIGNLSLGVAHEIQNPNTFSRVNAVNLQELFSALKPLLEALAAERPDTKVGKLTIPRILGMVDNAIDGVHKASDRIAEVLDGLKQFGKTDSGHIATIDVHAAVAEAALLTKHLVKDQCLLIVDLPAEPLQVRGALTQLSQVFVNLIENAVLAIRGNPGQQAGLIEIYIERAGRDELQLAVRDNGPGIDPAIQDKIFRPYFTTRAQGEGTGLGLSISSDILHRFGGSLSVRSKPGDGATFVITLARAEVAVQAIEEEG